MSVNIQRIPAELQDRPQWVLWRIVTRDGQETKLPYQVGGDMAKSNDPTTWTTCSKVFAAARGYNGIGFVFAADDPYCGIDLDGCRDPQTGTVAEWAREIILAMGSYAEVSPSGIGVKIWIRGKWKGQGHKQPVDAPKTSDKTPAIEIYDSLRYFAVTGRQLQGMGEIIERQEQLDALQEKFWKATAAAQSVPPVDFRSDAAVVDRARKYVAKMPVSVSGSGGHNAAFHVACTLCLGFGLSDGDALALMQEWNAGCQPPWSERDLRHKVEQALKQPGDRGYLRNVAPQNYERVKVPAYKMPTPKPEPKITTLESAATSYVETLKSGRERLMDLGIPELDHAIGGGAEPGELFLLAARPSHGKSAVALQMAHHLTSQGKPIAFVSEEMSALAIGKRALQYASDVPQEHWTTRVEVLERQLSQHFSGRAPCILIEQCRTAEAAAEAIRAAKKEHNIECAIVDYAQLLGSEGKGRYEQITNTSVCLRQITSETQILLVALCQLNRQIEQRHPFVPKMCDLRDTGQLEQDADVLVFSVWPHRIDPHNDPYEYQFFVAKNRNRAINEPALKCRFEPSRQRFVDNIGPIDRKYERAYFGHAPSRDDSGFD